MTDSNKNLPTKVENHPDTPSVRLWPVWLIALLALLLALALAFWSWTNWQEQQSLQETVNRVSQTTERLDGNLTQTNDRLAQRLQTLENRLTEQRETIAAHQRQIDHNAREMLEAGSRTRTDWLLAEAEYLIRIANQRLQIEKDFKGALAALQEADDVLNETDDVGAYPVRQQLARDIMALKSIAGVDRTGLYLQLEAAIEGIQQLTDSALVGEQRPPLPAGKTDSDGADSAKQFLQRAWHQAKETLGDVVVVRRLDEPVKPLLSPEQSGYVQLNLQLMLEEAELALLRQDQTVYERALAKARDTLSHWYDDSNSRVQALQDTLEELQGKAIDPELPDISKSLELLKARLAGRSNSEDGDNNTGTDDQEAES
ncbi:MAG: uroporphyrinogen-III C-methyltransferase [Oleiphilaceae bacterium]|nr:uroporphyrinogen-III C-methyltransferase [Oleiphilaceae bacterium]